MQAAPMMLSAAAQTAVRQPPRSGPVVTAIAIAGSQNRAKVSRVLERMSRDLPVVAPHSMTLTHLQFLFYAESNVIALYGLPCGIVGSKTAEKEKVNGGDGTPEHILIPISQTRLPYGRNQHTLLHCGW